MRHKTLFVFLLIANLNLFSQSVSLSTTSVTVGGTVRVNWTGFTGNVNLLVYKGSTWLGYATTTGAGSGYLDLVTTGWEVGNDYWAKVELKTNTSIFRTTSNFSVTTQPPTIPVLTYPSSGAILNKNTPDLTWTADNANYFHIQVSTNSSFTNIVRENTSCYSFNWTPSSMSDGTYYWRVKSSNNSSWSNWSSYRYFTIQTVQPPSIPTLTYPANGATLNDNTPDLTWTADNANYFHIQVSTNSSFTNIVRENTSCYSFNWTPSSMSDGTYYWRVKSSNNSSWSNWSSYRYFTIQTVQPPSIPTLTYPANGATLNDNTPDLTWTADNANYFHIQVSTNSSFTNIVRENTSCYSFNWTPSSMSDGTYYWQVKSSNNSSWSNWSSYRYFTIQTTPPPPSLISPNGEIPNTSQIEFLWNNVSGAGRYRVKICTDQNMSTQISGSPFEAEYGATSIFIPVNSFNPGQTYYWQVASIYPNDIGGWGSYGPTLVWSFKVSESQSFILITPSANQPINSNYVDFSWAQVPEATHYELYVDNNSGLGSPEISPQHIKELKNLTSTSYTISGNWLTPGHNYFWKVIAKDASGSIIAESATGTFSYAPELETTPTWAPMYLAFHPDVVDHFYCTSQSHLQTAIDNNYRFEGAEGYVALFPFEIATSNQLVPIYRFYQHNEDITKVRCHYYTSDGNDRDNRIIQGWIYEGIIGYGFKQADIGLTPLYHTYLNVPNNRRDNFYSVSEIKKNNSISLFGYQDMGQVCYVSATGDNSTMTWLSGSMMAGIGINPFNGNFGNSSKNIFSLPEGNVALNYSHSYNSNSVRLLQATEPLGVGRNHSYNISLQKTDRTIYVLWGDEVHIYDSLSCKTPGVYDELEYVNQTTYRIRKKDQSIFTFQKLAVNNITNTFWLSSISDRHGNTITLEYNSNGWLKHVKSPANRFISFTYYPSSDPDKYGLIRYVKDSLALNRTVEYIYDNQRNLIEFKDVAGKSTVYKYDENYPFDHFLTEITYSDGTKITNTYDVGSKRLTSQNYVSETLSKVTSVSLPTAGQVSITDEMNVVTNIKYNSIGNISELLTAAGDVKYEYSDNSNPTKPTKITDGMGYITTVKYDNRGNPEIITKPLNVIHSYTWNSTNDLIGYKNPMDKTSTFTYSNGKLTAIQSPFGQSSSATTTINYYGNGNVQSIINPLGRTTNYTYDTYNNVKTIADHIGNTTSYTYDAASRVKSIKDANNHTTLYNYTIDDLLNENSDPMNHKTSYYYDDLGRLTDVEDAKNNKTSMVYQPQTGLLNLIRDQLGNNTTFTYFDNGLLNTKTTRNNHKFTFEYDEGNRLKSITAPSINRSFTYNDNDLLTQLSDNNGNLTFKYDPLNRLTSHTGYYADTVAYEYDNANNIIKVGYPGGKSVEYYYYDHGSINKVKDWLGNITQYFYNLDGSLSRVNNPNGTYSEYTYDAAGRLTGLANKKSDNSIINSYTLVLDGVGNHIEVTVTEPLTSPIPDASTITYSYNRANRIERAGNITFSHDLNGNMTSQNDNGLITNFTFSAEDMLTGVSGAFNASYQYDGMGYRRQATRNGVTTSYVLDVNGSMESVLMETNASNQPLYYYIHGNGLLYRIKASDNSVQYYHTDLRGSTIAITDHAQNLTHQYAYDEFGNVSNSVEPKADFNAFRYVGKYGVMYENEDLFFMRARYYKPTLGRFVSEDPVWFPNLYVYSNNDPVNRIDPKGLIEFDQSEWEKTKKAMLLRELMYYQQESAKHEQREMKLAQYVIVLEFIEEASALVFSATGGGPALGIAQAGIKGTYGMFTGNSDMVKNALIDLSVGFIAGKVSGKTDSFMSSTLGINQGVSKATEIFVGFGLEKGAKTIINGK